MRRFWLWVPFAIFFALIGMFAKGLLTPEDRSVPSAMVNKPLPQFALTGAIDPAAGLETGYYRDGKSRLVNVFASWCVPCVAEIPVLLQLQQKGVEVTGIAVHDRADALQKFLADNGNPYSRIASDANSRTQIGLGSAGVPETFVVDGKGMIVHQHIGVITPEDVPAILAKLKGGQ